MRKFGKPAPHKALLLLSVIDLIELKDITDCHICLTDRLIQQFKINTEKYFSKKSIFHPSIPYPYFHMRSEKFWKIVTYEGDEIIKLSNFSISSLRQRIKYACIDNELYELLQDSYNREILRTILLSIYINNKLQSI